MVLSTPPKIPVIAYELTTGANVKVMKMESRWKKGMAGWLTFELLRLRITQTNRPSKASSWRSSVIDETHCGRRSGRHSIPIIAFQSVSRFFSDSNGFGR